MRKMINIIRLIAVTVITMALSGCGMSLLSAATPDTDTYNVAVINAANCNSTSINIEDIRPIITDVASNYGHFSYIIGDGKPFVALSEDIERPTDNPSKQNRLRRANTESKKIAERISTAYPVSNETDILAAIRLAAKELSPYKDSVMIVYTTGLSTSGVDMTQLTSLEQTNVNETVESLIAAEAIPDLTGISVEFRFIQTAGEQETLTNKAENIIIALWKNIVEYGGGTFQHQYYINDEPEIIEYQTYVTPVNIGSSQNYIIKEYALEEIPEDLFETSAPEDIQITIGEEEIEFLPDSAELKDITKAKEKLVPLAEMITEYDVGILLIGSTATVGNADSSITLSEKRCEVIRQLLCELGVSTDIKIKGFGYSKENPFFTDDIKDGKLVEKLAASNRKVVIVNLDSEIAKEIMG